MEQILEIFAALCDCLCGNCRKEEESESTDKYAVVKIEGIKNLEAEFVVLGENVYTMFKSGVAEDALGQWFDGADLAELGLESEAENFVEATTFTLVRSSLRSTFWFLR